MTLNNTQEGWIMVFISSLACVLGASIVIFGGRALDSKKFLSSTMALGGGVLIFNSLYTLLPASKEKFNSDGLTFMSFFGGIFFTLCLSNIIQWCTPHAIHTCDPLGHKNQDDNISQVDPRDEEHNLVIPFNHHADRKNLEYGTVEMEGSENQDKNDYFLIGIQTAIAICIHKFPEGLIMFVSNESSSQLGLNVATAIIIHNFIEGFLIAIPLFYATRSKYAAFAYAAILGGMSQPLGAIIGVIAFKSIDQIQENYFFGVIFGVVSGMMCLIAINSMLPQAIHNDSNGQLVPISFFSGIFLIGITTLLHSS